MVFYGVQPMNTFMQKKKVYNFLVLIEQAKDGWFVARVPDIQGCVTQGKTIEQVLERVKEAIQVCLESTGKSTIKNFDERRTAIETI